MKLIFATRPSKLARWQTNWVINEIKKIHPNLECEEKVITTQGDKVLDKSLPEIGGKGVFTQELESELLNGDVHCAVHSLKDLPVENPVGLTVGCIPLRAEARDALIARQGEREAHPYKIKTLPQNAVVGTSSLRRAAQLLALRPDLKIESLRGNVDTRLRKVGIGLAPIPSQYDAIILAGAGLIRLGLDSHVTEWIPLNVMLPAPGQGALAIQCRADDSSTLEILSALEDESTRKCVTAERAFLQGLGGGCAVPVAAYAEMIREQRVEISLTGLIASPDGKKLIRVTGNGIEAKELGHQLAQQAIAQGASEILSLLPNH